MKSWKKRRNKNKRRDSNKRDWWNYELKLLSWFFISQTGTESLLFVCCLAQQASQETLKRRQESERNRPPVSTNGELPQAPRAPRMTKAAGWLPSADSGHTRSEFEDPLLQQIENIQSFLRQAREAQRADEVAMLEENLRQLQDEYDQQQTSLAIALSQKLAKEESLQQGEFHRLEAREREEREEREHWGPAVTSTQSSFTVERSLDISPVVVFQGEQDTAAEELTPKAERSPASLRAFPALTSQEESPPRLRSLGGHITPPGGEGQNSTSLNPFDEEDATPTEEDPNNPFSEDIKREHKDVANGKKVYNPFDEDVREDTRADTQADAAAGNPFEEDDNTDTRTPFMEASGDSPGVSTNPFDGEDDGEALPDLDMIEEELLLQQIDNIRAYIFDAKLSGRLDEVELLSENLRELQHTLQEQKKKKHWQLFLKIPLITCYLPSPARLVHFTWLMSPLSLVWVKSARKIRSVPKLHVLETSSLERFIFKHLSKPLILHRGLEPIPACTVSKHHE